MNAGEGAAAKVGVVFLLAMIRQRLARHLPSRNSPPVCERRNKEGVDRPQLLEVIQHLLHAFIDERYGAHLDTDHPLRGLASACLRCERLSGYAAQRNLGEIAAC